MSAEKNIYTHLHLRGNELRGFVFARLESDPDPIDGRIYYNVAKNEFRACISGVWVNIFSVWHVDDDGNITTDKQVIIKNNLIVEDDTSSGGEGEDTPSAGLDETRLQEYLDEHKYMTEDDIAGLIPSKVATVDYVNSKFNSIDLSPYAKTTELNALANRVTPIETWMDNVGQHITYDAELDAIVINHNHIVTKDTSSGGEGEDTPASGIRGIYMNNVPYTDKDGDGFIDLGTISGGVSEITASMITSALGYTPANGEDYLPLAGGRITGNSLDIGREDNYAGAFVKIITNASTSADYGTSIRHYEKSSGSYTYKGLLIDKNGAYYSNNGSNYDLIHSGNYSSFALPLSGGTLESNITSTVLKIKGSTNAWIGYYGPSGYLGEIGYIGRVAQCTDADGNAKVIIHGGNIGSHAVLLDGGGTITRGNFIMSSTASDVVTNKLYPRADGSYELGQTSRRWSTIYGVNGNFSGNVGIGTSSPAYKLDVNGVTKASALRTTYIGIDCDADGNTSGYGSEINRFGANLYLQSREGNLYLSHSAGTTYIRGLLSVAGNITPSVHVAYNLGAYGNAFGTTHSNIISSGANGNNLWLVGGANDSSFGIQFARNADGGASGKIGSWDAAGLYPATNNAYSLGLSSNRWSAIYANISRTGSIDTSSLYYNNLNAVGWKKVAVDNKKTTSSNVIISIRRQYNNSNNETYTFLINCAYNGQTTITQIGGHANYRLITQIAVYNPASPYDRAIYIYYNTTASNQVCVNCIGDFDAITPVSATLPSSNVKTMNTVSSGFATTGDAVIYGDVAAA